MDNDNDNQPNNETGGQAPLPKHIPFPEISTVSELLNELFMFIFILFSAAMQFLHIYRTVWWLPESYVNNAINFYLIDPYLVVFITLIVGRRLIYCLLKTVQIGPKSKKKTYKAMVKYGYVAALVLILGVCVLNVTSKENNYLTLFLLLYPIVVYTLIFGFHIEPFLRTCCEIEGSYVNGLPMHCCSTNPAAIRSEIEILKDDFNNRFKQIIFTSLINSYYAGFVPCFFAQNHLYYDVTWATQHTIFIGLGGFTMCIVFCFPAKYSDVLHRAALHLGKWTRIDGRSTMTLPPATWTKSVPWVQESIVRHSGDLYKSGGPVTTATPGNLSHYRFFNLFNNPSVIYMIFTGLQTFLIVLQLLVLCFAVEWHNVLSLSFLILTNHHTLFKLIRDYLVTQKVYSAESSIYEKLNTHFN